MRRLILGMALASFAGTTLAQPPPSSSPTLKSAPGGEQVKTADEIKRESLEGAASAPLRDLNVLRAKIPDVLKAAMADPYARPPLNYRCDDLIGLVGPLDEALGPDIDVVQVEDEDFLDRGRQTALGAAADLASDAIPFRGWVRRLSGAEAHDRLVRDAIIAGGVRRAYLKGLGETKGCNPPATPSHERAALAAGVGPATPGEQPRGSLRPRFPTRPAPAEPTPSAGTPQTVPGRQPPEARP